MNPISIRNASLPSAIVAGPTGGLSSTDAEALVDRSSGDSLENPYRSPRLPDQPSQDKAGKKPAKESLYNKTFWLAYAANGSLVAANYLMFRYIEFVRLYETEQTRSQLGLIVGVGMIGSLLMRLVQGGAIDRYGARRIWIGSTLLYVASAALHLGLSDVHGPAVFILRMLYTTALAGAFGSSMVFISRRASPERMAEMVGTLGTSGFIGMMIGPIMGDWLFSGPAAAEDKVRWMFLWASALGSLAVLFSWVATWGSTPPTSHHRRPPMLWLLKRYYPGPVLWVGVSVGVALAFTTNFLPDFAQQRGMSNIASYFNAFAVTAFATRLSIRQFPTKYGIRMMLIVGAAAQAISFLLFLPVQSAWMFALPGAAAGFGHAFLFPGVVAGGGTAFPARYRGIGTALMMGTFDLGILVGAPVTGFILDNARGLGVPAYPAAIGVLWLALTSVLMYFMWRPNQRVVRYRPALEVSDR